MIDAETAALLENYFDRIFVVSIKRVTDRHERVREQLQGLSFEFFWGFDKEEADWNDQQQVNSIYNEMMAKKYNRVGKPMNHGEIACSISHRMLYEHIIANRFGRVLVLEDDVVPLKENLFHLKNVISELPGEWELLYLGYTKHEIVTKALKRKQFFYKLISPFRMIKWSPVMVKNMLPRKISPHLKKAGYHDCTHAYAITLHAAEKLIPMQRPVVFKADNLLSYLILNEKLKAFVSEPQFFAQENQLDPNHPSIIKEIQ